MPRPPFKRKRSNAPANHHVPNIASSSPRIRRDLESKLADKAVGARPGDSDDSDRLVRKLSNVRNRRNIPRQEIYASGGVAMADAPGSHPSRRRKSSNAQANQAKTLQAPTSALQSRAAQLKLNPTPVDALLDRPPQSPGPSPTQSSQSVVVAKSVLAAPTPLRGTPIVGASMLASLKPRRRLPSILQLVDNHDSSSINVDDEAEFLPDDESTPLKFTKSAAATSTPNSSLSLQSNSRKRKFSPALTSHTQPTSLLYPPLGTPEPVIQVAASSPAESDLPTLLAPSTKTSKQRKHQADDCDIMAPPESSSSAAPSPVKPKDHSPVKGKRHRKAPQTGALSTEALQALMPKRPNARQYRRQEASEFDIPLDEDGQDGSHNMPTAGSDIDEQSFVPAGRRKKAKVAARRKEPISKPSNARTKARNQRASSTLSPTKNTRLATKSPSQQPRTASKVVKPSTYASRRRQTERAGSVLDKENRPAGLSEDFLGDGAASGSLGREVSSDRPSASVQALRDKFAEIDDWDMEFEEVDVSSSDPMMR